MVSIIQRRKNMLAFPFTTDLVGQQFSCLSKREPIFSLSITAIPLLACSVRVANKEKEDGLKFDNITIGQLLSVSVRSLAGIQCAIRCVPAMGMTIRKASLLSCDVSATPLLRASITKGSLLNGTITSTSKLGLTVSCSPTLTAKISRPIVAN